MKAKNWITAPQLAKVLGVSVATLYRHLEKGPSRGGVDPRKIPDKWVRGRRYWDGVIARRIITCS